MTDDKIRLPYGILTCPECGLQYYPPIEEKCAHIVSSRPSWYDDARRERVERLLGVFFKKAKRRRETKRPNEKNDDGNRRRRFSEGRRS